MNDTQTTTYSARESWLNAAVDVLRPRFETACYPVPEKLRVAVGFGPTGARKESAKILGVTLHTSCSEDGVNEIWISPEHATTGQILGTLVHELIHAALNNEDGHKGRFAECATRVGLSGPMMATYAEGDLLMELEMIASSLGEYPGAMVDTSGIFAEIPVGTDGNPIPIKGGGRVSSGPKTQGTRMRKVVCDTADCACGGYTVRTTAKWLEIGLPSCPMGNQMIEA